MRKKNYRQVSAFRSVVPGFLIFAAVFIMVLYGLTSTRTTVDDEGIKNAELSVRRAIVTCYSIEGRYPATFDYLKDNYGISIDESRYIVHYQIFSTNLMPDVTVVRR